MRPVYISGIGAVTRFGVGYDFDKWIKGEAEAGYDLSSFRAAPYLSDKRMLKAVSPCDALGLVAAEDLNKTFSGQMSEDPYRNGLYVGAPPASAFDNQYYFDAMQQTARGGVMSTKDFGATCMTSKPTTLLIGLPNNVLCYASIILGVKGPNSNYTATFISGHQALITGAKRVARGQIDVAAAGGFSMHSDAINASMFEKNGVASKDHQIAAADKLMPIADGSVFLGLTTKKEQSSSLVFVDGATASDGLGPFQFDPYGHTFEKMILDLLHRNSVGKESVGLILANASGFDRLDLCEKTVLSRVYANERVLPALGCSRGILGHLMEAGGLAECMLAKDLFETGHVPEMMRLKDYDSEGVAFADKVDASRPYALILRASPSGEYSAVLTRVV